MSRFEYSQNEKHEDVYRSQHYNAFNKERGKNSKISHTERVMPSRLGLKISQFIHELAARFQPLHLVNVIIKGTEKLLRQRRCCDKDALAQRPSSTLWRRKQ